MDPETFRRLCAVFVGFVLALAIFLTVIFLPLKEDKASDDDLWIFVVAAA